MGIHHKFAIFPDICYFCCKPLLNCNLNFYLSVSVHFYDSFYNHCNFTGIRNLLITTTAFVPKHFEDKLNYAVIKDTYLEQ